MAFRVAILVVTFFASVCWLLLLVRFAPASSDPEDSETILSFPGNLEELRHLAHLLGTNKPFALLVNAKYNLYTECFMPEHI